MKKSIYIIATITVFCLTSCEDFLNVKPRGYDTPSKMEHYQGLLLGQELWLMDESFPYMCFECFMDKNGYDNAYSTIGSNATNAYKWEKEIYREDETCGEWNSFTNPLYYYNVVINQVMDAEDGTPEEKLALQSEARMLRAYCTFMMSQFFGRVPIITSASTTSGDYSLRSIDEVNEFIVSEMSEALGHLKDDPEHFKRVFRTTGLAMYGKVLFYLGRYDDALVQLEAAYKAVKARAEVGLTDYYERVTEDGQVNYIVYDYENPEILFMLGSMNRIWPAVYGSMYNMLLLGVKNEVIRYFFYDLKDTRLGALSSVSSGKTAYMLFKPSDYYCANMANIKSNVGIGVPQLYTMYAECLARAGRLDEAAAVLLEFRDNRMDPGHEALPSDVSSKEAMVRFAFEEAMREQIGFGTSWFDMKRVWNDPVFQYMKDYYVHTVGNETYTLSQDRLDFQYPPSVTAWHPEYLE